MAKLSEVFTSSSSSSESKSRSTSRRIERTSIRTYYSNADLATHPDQEEYGHQNSYGRPMGSDHQREFVKNRFGGQEFVNGNESPNSLRDNFIPFCENKWGSPIRLKANSNGSRDFRVRSPSLPPISRSALR